MWYNNKNYSPFLMAEKKRDDIVEKGLQQFRGTEREKAYRELLEEAREAMRKTENYRKVIDIGEETRSRIATVAKDDRDRQELEIILDRLLFARGEKPSVRGISMRQFKEDEREEIGTLENCKLQDKERVEDAMAIYYHAKAKILASTSVGDILSVTSTYLTALEQLYRGSRYEIYDMERLRGLLNRFAGLRKLELTRS